MNRILVATDGSPASREAVQFGIELAEEQGAAVVFVHVLRRLDLVPMAGFGMVGARLHEESPEDQHVLEDADTLAYLREVPSTTKLLKGDVVDEIVAYADNLDVDLIVIGSRGHGALTNALLGSVSRGVLSESKRPVAVVRASTEAKALASV
jgi:nucleotide-binding universal stress UspA family protein